MKALKRPALTGSRKLVTEIKQARLRLTIAKKKLELARERARATKRTRKAAKQAARRAKKIAQQAKAEFAEAKQSLDKNEARSAGTSEQNGKARRLAKKKLVTKAAHPKKAAPPRKNRAVSSTRPHASRAARRNSHIPRLMKKVSAARPAMAGGKRPVRAARNFATPSGAIAPILEMENLVPEGYVIEQLGESKPAGVSPSKIRSH